MRRATEIYWSHSTVGTCWWCFVGSDGSVPWRRSESRLSGEGSWRSAAVRNARKRIVISRPSLCRRASVSRGGLSSPPSK